MGYYSDYLFASPSFWEGMARIVDFGNTMNEYNSSPSDDIADEVSLRMDWGAVGYSLQKAIGDYDKEEESPKEFALTHR